VGCWLCTNNFVAALNSAYETRHSRYNYLLTKLHMCVYIFSACLLSFFFFREERHNPAYSSVLWPDQFLIQFTFPGNPLFDLFLPPGDAGIYRTIPISPPTSSEDTIPDIDHLYIMV